MSVSVKARCNFCKRDVPVTVTGRLRKHKAILQTSQRFGVWCENTSPHATPETEESAQ